MAQENIEQERLIEQLKQGSKDAFHSLFNLYAPKIQSFALSYLGNKADAEELLQELFLKIWEIRSTLDSSKNIKSFLFKVCVNLIYDYIRRKNIEKAYTGYAGQMDQATADSTWQEVIYNDMLANLNNLVNTMPEQRQLIFRLSKEQGLTNEEIARQLGLSKRTVENQLYRAVSYLKEKIGQGTIAGILFFYLHCS
jgi:RNA polymerase sigma-70 factor (ECF subfamily)